MKNPFNFRDFEAKFGNDKRRWAERRSRGNRSKNEGTEYERSYAVFRILSEAKACQENQMSGRDIIVSGRPQTLVDDLLIAQGNRVVLSEAKYRKRISWKKVKAPIEAQLRWNATFRTLDVSIELVVPTRDQETALLSSSDAIAGVRVERFACDLPSSEYLRGCFFAERSDAASLENLIDLVKTAWLRRGMQASVYNIMADARTKSFNKVLSLESPYDLNGDEKKLLATFNEMKFEIRIDQLGYSHREHAIWTWLPFPLGSSAWHALVDELKLASPRNFIQFGKIAGRIWEATNAS